MNWKGLLWPSLLAVLWVSPAFAGSPAVEWRYYGIPGYGTLALEAPAAWKPEVRQSDSDRPPTIVFRPKRGEAFELLVTPIYVPGGQPPGIETLEAAVAQNGAKHLSEAREDSLRIKSLTGEQVSGRYFQLTESEPPPPGEYPSVLSGSLVTGPIVASFTLLHRDPQAEYVQQVLGLLASARFDKGVVGTYRASIADLELKILIAAAAGLEPEFLLEKPKKLQVRLGPYLLDAVSVRGGIRIRLDGPNPEETQELFEALTIGFPVLD